MFSVFFLSAFFLNNLNIVEYCRLQFRCDVCDSNFAYKRGLTEHNRIYHGAYLVKYSCMICSSQFATKYLWKKHLYENHDLTVDIQESEEYARKIKNTRKSKKCLKSKWLISILYNIYRHSYAFSGFFTVVQMRAKKKQARIIRKLLTCNICGTTASGTFNLMRHKRTKHPPESKNSWKKRLACKWMGDELSETENRWEPLKKGWKSIINQNEL